MTANVTAFVVAALAAAYAAFTGITNGLAWVVAVFHGGVAIGLVLSYASFRSETRADTAAA